MNHIVQFYEDDAFICDTVARFIGAGLAAGEAVIVISTDSHRQGFVQRLKANAFDVDRATREGWLTLLDAREMLAGFMVDDMPDWERFSSTFGALIERVAGGRHARAYGEMVDLLWRDGNQPAAIRLEEMWNDLGRSHNFSLLCAYLMGNFYKESDGTPFRDVCRTHAPVVPTESYSTIDDTDSRLREVSMLQQRAQALQTEIEHRKNIEQHLAGMVAEQVTQKEQTAEKFRLIVESVSDYAIFLLDPGGHVASWNLGAERIKGYRAEEIVGKHFSNFYLQEEVNAGKCEYELEVAAAEGRFEDEGWRVRKDGTQFWANVVISRVLGKTGELLGYAKVTRDLTQRRALENERLARAAAEVELSEHKRIEEFREQLLAMVGHDLRSPLSAIAMSANLMLKRDTLPDAEVKMVARIARNADRMTALISQLLDFTRARLVGGFSLEPKQFHLAGLCSEIVDDCQSAHPEATLCLDPDIDTEGLWDRERLAQVVSNLVGNAIQHGIHGRPIDIRVSDEGDDVVLTVHNEGIPIPAEVLPAIFDPFRQGIGPARNKTKSDSLGLGLFIAREIVRAHGGEISAQSAEGEGTTFTVRLPRGKR